MLLEAEFSTGSEKLSEMRQLLARVKALRPDWGRLPLLEARIDEREGKIDEAIGHYRQAFDLGERSGPVVYRLAELLQGRQRFVEAGKVLATFEMQTVLSPNLARMGADVALAGANIDRALALSRLAVSHDSQDYCDYLWLAGVDQQAQRLAGDPAPTPAYLREAERCLRQATQLAPQAPDTWAALVNISLD